MRDVLATKMIGKTPPDASGRSARENMIRTHKLELPLPADELDNLCAC